MKRVRTRGPILAAAVLLAAGVFAEPVVACSLVQHADNGRYLGGGLVAQISAKAELIQIVRVRAKHVVTRTYSLGSWYLDTGETDVPDGYPDYVDQFVFELEIVDTLKGELDGPAWAIERNPRILGYDHSLFGSGAYPVAPSSSMHPNRLPDWLFDRPGDQGYAFIGANENSGLGGGECAAPYFLEVGQTLVALRRSDGRLYPTNSAFPLEIDTEFAIGEGRQRRGHLNMQSLIPIIGSDDSFVVRLREAIATGG